MGEGIEVALLHVYVMCVYFVCTVYIRMDREGGLEE